MNSSLCMMVGVFLTCYPDLQSNRSVDYMMLQNPSYEQPGNYFVYIPPEIKARSDIRVRDMLIDQCMQLHGSVKARVACIRKVAP